VVIFGIIELKKLKEHEETDPTHLVYIQKRIEQDGLLKNPIIVDKKTKIILDGHHRYNSLKNLNCSKIAVYFVDYSSSEIKVKGWKKTKIVTKRDVIKAGLSENKLPPKTSRHIIPKRPLNLCISLNELK
jgi:uridine kinase